VSLNPIILGKMIFCISYVLSSEVKRVAIPHLLP